jgi:predicted  nucleic acid-binding Zn-ribbon protein
MKTISIRVQKATDPHAWYAKHVGETFTVSIFEANRCPSQGIPEDVYWVRTSDTYNTLNYIRASDAEVLSDTRPMVVPEQEPVTVYSPIYSPPAPQCAPNFSGQRVVNAPQCVPARSPDIARIAEELYALLVPVRTYSEHLKSITAFLAREFAAKDAEIARLTTDRDSWMRQADDRVDDANEFGRKAEKLEAESNERLARAERAEAEMAEAKKSHDSERLLRVRYEKYFDRAIVERDQLRAEIAKLNSEYETVCTSEKGYEKEVAQLRAALGGEKVGGEWLSLVRLEEREERLAQADATITALRAEVGRLTASETKAHYEREDAKQSLELCRAQLAAAQEDGERLRWAIDHPERFARIARECVWTPFVELNNALWRERIDAARKEASQ